MATYETIFILDSLLPPEDIDKVTDRVKEIIETNGGKVTTLDKWGKRRMAYEIEKKQYGFYVAVEFTADSQVPALLESEFNYNDKVLRYLTYLFDKNKLKSIELEKRRAAKSPKQEPKPEMTAEKETKPKPEENTEKTEVPDEKTGEVENE